jgi:hypothetical protein
LLETVKDGSAGGATIATRARKRLWELLESGAFYEGIPHGVVLTMSKSGEAVGFRFGPVGLAAVSDAGVRLLHADDRFPALEKLGAKLPDRTLADPLVSAVSSLTQLAPEDGGSPVSYLTQPNEAVMLLSRGALPFSLPVETSALGQWARLDAGWRHGMSGAVVQVLRKGERPTWELFPWVERGSLEGP